MLTKENINSFPLFEDRSNGLTLQSIDINEALAKEQMQNLRVNKTPGPDGLHPRILSKLSNKLIESHALLFRKSLDEGVVTRA